MPGVRAVGRVALKVLVALAAVALIVVIAYAIDTRGEPQVARNVTLSGADVGGLNREQLAPRVRGLAERVATGAIRIRAPEGGIDTTAAALGVAVREEATVEATLGVGRDGHIVRRIWEWARSFLRDSRAPVELTSSEPDVYAVVTEHDPGPKEAATEPTIALEDGEFVVVDGKDGEGIDPRDVIDALPAAAAAGVPMLVEVDRGDVEPRFDEEDAEAVAEEAEAINRNIAVRIAGNGAGPIVADDLRSWLRAEPRRDGLRLGVAPERAMEALEKQYDEVGKRPVDARLVVEGGSVRIIAGETGTACCAPEAVELLEEALQSSEANPSVTLPLRTEQPALTAAKARALNIKEPIGTFTTAHPAGQPRVQNIHRIADLLRGTVILPGETFSVNGTVGRRTKDKGFVAAPVIEEGRFSEGVGGGISQFATTLFNAAFFAGLDFGEYQSHSIYISRYPYGREATLSFPHPDLQIENTTPHGVLLWPEYTDRTITVTLYSTRFATGEQTGQTKSQRGNCTRVSTERTRTYVDGRTKVDHVFATYRPGEGVNC
jgi:vancomycin resistance protein YoaR